jgi:hypothetical protein
MISLTDMSTTADKKVPVHITKADALDYRSSKYRRSGCRRVNPVFSEEDAVQQYSLTQSNRSLFLEVKPVPKQARDYHRAA